MSRTGYKEINIPSGVDIKVESSTITVKGPKGTLTSPIFEKIKFKNKDNVISLTRESEEKSIKAKHGLTRALLANCIEGVTKGFQKNLQIIGVGYRAAIKEKNLSLNIGFSKEILFPIPEGISIEVKDNTKITVSGIDKQQVGQIAAQIRGIRPPEPYKGKGIRYADEVVRKKAGKAGKK
jgi:large subunit ribosomal protein L6